MFTLPNKTFRCVLAERPIINHQHESLTPKNDANTIPRQVAVTFFPSAPAPLTAQSLSSMFIDWILAM
ncbi:hypothetical protein AYI68_g2163 [Smittium mucronatum]|uniref:Uncharacterized protein n=1 Tax=Smittium mucronatum TaxID=133383 RepID=A0A1R0H3E4_9FUNG|nr:hypothetical protein AYI68_g2163 [Smittium mucronatum]